MFKKTMVIVFAVLLSLSFLAGTVFATGQQGGPKGPMTPAAQIQAPSGKTLLSLPVDQVSPKTLRIAAIMVQNNPFGVAVLQGQNFAKQILADRNCIVDPLSVPDFDAQKWTSVIDNCIASGYNAICAFGVSDALQPVIKRAADAGILVYLFNSQLSEPRNHVAFYGQGGVDGGRQCGEALAKLMNNSGKYAIITGDFAAIGHEQRRTGAREVLDKIPGIKLVGEVMNNDKAEEAYNHAANFITANPDLKGIYVTAGGPSGAAKAVEDAGMKGKIFVVCHDVLAESAPYVGSGTISACLDQDPFNQGYQCVVDAFNQLMTGKKPPAETYYKGVMATPQTVKQLFPELF
ncbi:MAG: sugar ABC transporter substrate-binding protein [Treponema sp.]|nr:sugar ABC transporter substrate-binding protein [Treponema sp.]